MSKEDGRPNAKQQAETERKFSQEHYDMLIRCSKKGHEGIKEWNKWRQQERRRKVLLQGANFGFANLQGADLSGANLQDAWLLNANLQDAYLGGANLQDAYLGGANLQDACLGGANLQGANFGFANLQGADLSGANLQDANLQGAYLQGAWPLNANLQDAYLRGANLQDACLGGANLQGADLMEAHLEKAGFWKAKLQGADFSRAIVDGGTLICEKCTVDRDTKFEAVAFGNMRIYPRIRQLLEYNIRRMNWEQWYRGESKSKLFIATRQLVTSPVRLFWFISNYGLSTWRIIFTFSALAIIFATVYFACGAVDYYYSSITDQPGIVRDLFVQVADKDPVSAVYYGMMVYFRSIYFSVVTMTTLGFGDMYANTASWGWRWWVGHSLLIVQVLLGYILLGALVTRFAVLFSAGGPAGTFTKREPRKRTKPEEGEKPKNEQKQ